MNNIDDYAKWTKTIWTTSVTDMLDSHDLFIMSLGLGGEIGESLEVIKKSVRDDNMDLQKFKKEMGDSIYYWCMCLNYFNIDPSEVLSINVAKLEDRKNRGVLNGSGDDR